MADAKKKTDELSDVEAAIDYEAFVQRELEYRHATAYPPWSRLIRVLLDARKEGEAQSGARRVCDRLGRLDGVDVLGPAIMKLLRQAERGRAQPVDEPVTKSFRMHV